MKLSVKNVRVSLASSADFQKENISFQIAPEGRESLTIGSEYAFGESVLGSEKFQSASGRLHIEKIAESNKHLFEKNSIGYVKFFDAINDEFGQYSYPPLVVFSVYLPDERYETIKNSILKGQSVTYLMVGVDGFDFSWEPDGSHKIWNLKPNESSVTYSSLVDARVSSVDIGFGDNFDDEYHLGVEKAAVKNLITQKDVELFKEWQKRIQQYLGVITGAIVLLTLIVLF
jgi:hypothetical protein